MESSQVEPKLEEKKEETKESSGVYRCSICGKTFPSRHGLLVHMGFKHKKKSKATDILGERPPSRIPPEWMQAVRMEVNLAMKRLREEIPKLVVDTIKEAGLIPGDSEERKAPEPKIKELEVDEKVMRIKRPVMFYPEILTYYKWFIAKTGKQMTFDEFVNETIREHFEECLGAENVIIVRPEGGRR